MANIITPRTEVLTRVSRLATAFAALAAISLSGCGKSSYDPVDTLNQADGPGSYEIPAKVDILLAVDDTGSALNADVRTPMVNFLNRLNDRRWDFRVAVTPLSAYAGNVQQVAVSKFDIKYGSNYVKPYPGAPAAGSSLAVLPAQLLMPSATSSGGGERGIETIVKTLENEALYLGGGADHFLRPDAATFIIIISTSDDTSYSASEGSASNGTPPRVANDLVNRIRLAKGNSSALGTKIYSFVNANANPSGPYTQRSGCLGAGSSYSGNRYMQLTQLLSGAYFDLCSQQNVDAVFTELESAINNERKSYISEYVFVDKVPDLSTVEMKKTLEDGTEVVIPKASGSSGGWTYLEGYQTNLPSISYPVPMNFRSGYAFRITGKQYQLVGNDKPTVTFKERGLTASQ